MKEVTMNFDEIVRFFRLYNRARLFSLADMRRESEHRRFADQRLSRLMEVEALIVFPDMKSGALSQLTFSDATLIEMVTVLPLAEVTIELGLMVIVASRILESESICETCA